jgi:recombination protein RecR
VITPTQQDDPLQALIRQMARLPGLGQRSARRIALYLLQHRTDVMQPLAAQLDMAASQIHACKSCGNLDTIDPCRICRDDKREQSVICVVASVADIWAIERTGQFRGVYHVLGGVLSALDGIGPDDLNIPGLLTRVRDQNAREVILALGATVDGQTTAHVISDQLTAKPGLKITRLAQGLPVGGELDYMDEGTIGLAFAARTSL